MLEIEATLSWGDDRYPLWTRHFPARRTVTFNDVTIAWPRIVAPEGAAVSWLDDTHALVSRAATTLAISVAPRASVPLERRSLGVAWAPMALAAIAHLLVLSALGHYQPRTFGPASRSSR